MEGVKGKGYAEWHAKGQTAEEILNEAFIQELEDMPKDELVNKLETIINNPDNVIGTGLKLTEDV